MTTPLPPEDFARRDIVVYELAPGATIERFYPAQYEPIYFGLGAGRFNAPDDSFKTLYAAENLRGAFAETFLRAPGRTLLPIDLLAARARATLQIQRNLRLALLRGPALARIGATAEVVHGGLPYDISQAWAKALHDHPARPDGLAYTARHDDEALCFALFDRAGDALAEKARDVALDADWFWDLAEIYGVGLSG